MKQLFRSILSVAAAATLLIGCSKDATETPAPAAGEFTLNLVTGADTRTEIYDPGEGKGVNIKWSENDEAAIYVKSSFNGASKASITNDIATFTLQTSKINAADSYLVQSFYPNAAFARNNQIENSTIKSFGLKLPAAQEATTATFDKNADILVAKNLNVDVTEADLASENKTKTVEGFTFGRTTAITKITFKVTNAELTASEEKVRSIALSVENETEPKMLAGNFSFDPTAFEYVTDEGIADRNNIFYAEASNKVTVTLTDTPAVNAAFTAWISTAPVSLTNGDKLTFTVTTDAGTTITKTATVGKDLAFMTTRLNTMTVNLNDGVTIDKPVVVDDGEVMLTNKDIIANAPEKQQEYTHDAATLTAADGSVWDFKGYRTKSGNFLQIKNSENAHIKLPTVSGPIQKIVLTVGKSDQTKPVGGGNTRDYYFRTELGGQNIASGTGDSKVELDLTGKGDYTTGYIQVSGSTRVFDVTVYYVSGASSDEPQIIAQDITAPAVGGDYEATYTVNNPDEDVTGEPEVDGSVVTLALADQGSISYTVASNYTAESREGWIKLSTASGLSKTIKVTQQASKLEVSTEAITIADGATEATFTVTSPEFAWYITDPEGNDITAFSVEDIMGYPTTEPVTVTVTYTGTATGEIGQLIVWRNNTDDPQKKTVTVSKQAPVTQGDKDVTFVFKEMGYTNGQAVTSVEKHPIAIKFDDGTKYYDTGTGLRVYSSKTFTVSGATGITIKTIELTFGSGDNSNKITTAPEGYLDGTWSGSAQSVVFTIGGTSGHRRIASITVTYEGEAAPAEPVKLATPKVAATQDGTSVTLTWNAVANAAKYAYTIGSQSGETTETTVTVPMAEGTYDWSVTAQVADGETQYLNSDPATGSITVAVPSGDTKTAVFIAEGGYQFEATTIDGKAANTATDGTITIKQEQGSNTTNEVKKPESDHIRFYSGHTLTFEGANITKIEFTATTKSYSKDCTINAGGGTWTKSDENSTWENAAGSTKVELQATAQSRYTKIVVTYN